MISRVEIFGVGSKSIKYYLFLRIFGCLLKFVEAFGKSGEEKLRHESTGRQHVSIERQHVFPSVSVLLARGNKSPNSREILHNPKLGDYYAGLPYVGDFQGQS